MRVNNLQSKIVLIIFENGKDEPMKETVEKIEANFSKAVEFYFPTTTTTTTIATIVIIVSTIIGDGLEIII